MSGGGLPRIVGRLLGRPRARRERDPSAQAIRDWLCARIAAELGVERSEIRVAVPFERYGLDSRIVAAIAGDLEDWLGRAFAPTLLWDHPTIQQVSEVLAGDRSRRRPSEGAKSRCVADAGSGE